MPGCELDHLVVAAETLEGGRDHIERRLGVRVSAGGRHRAMGTHNCLLRLGERIYLEIIAIDPRAPAPGGPRWFGLDSPDVRQRISVRPRLVAWVARTDHLEDAVGLDCASFGSIRAMSRGDFNWRIAVPDEGAVPGGGVLPMLIAWDVPFHPADRLPESGCRLARLECLAPRPDWAIAILDGLSLTKAIDLVRAADDSVPALRARLATPAGEVLID